MISGPRRMLQPSELEPVHVDLRTVFLVGIAVWLLALVVSVVLTATDHLDGRIPWICVTGAVLGLLALAWESRTRAERQSR
ncbi:DUF2530 domain-containing protein [Cellulomonas sp. APG4]|uniref:DUF2530 domain-containing protein n=1 Tax=Cellulomonas sp. APG4 TaxID=1538656 RepID=UPI00137A4EC6|nr:DUF2530 domain-containing protein [Cellulomonas sp. APG4]